MSDPILAAFMADDPANVRRRIVEDARKADAVAAMRTRYIMAAKAAGDAKRTETEEAWADAEEHTQAMHLEAQQDYLSLLLSRKGTMPS